MKSVTSILLAVFFIALVGCSSPRTSVTTDDQSGRVMIKVIPQSSDVYVDGQKVGKAYDFNGSSAVLKLAPGKHTISVINGEKACRQDIYLSDTQEVIQCNLE